jgi:LuxR family maltose regulon positive regulatory protein
VGHAARFNHAPPAVKLNDRRAIIQLPRTGNGLAAAGLRDATPSRANGKSPPAPVTAIRHVVPELPTPFVERERLLSQLDAVAVDPVVLISAPAGWGKTTLLASWSRTGRAPGPVVYFRASPGDGVEAWDALTRGLADVDPSTGSSIVPTDLPLVLVLDDLHEVTSEAALERVEQLLQRAGDSLRVVLLTRGEPRLPLYRWRLSGRLAEIQASWLSFTLDDIRELLRARGIALAPGSLRRFHALTEGWPAALTLAASSMAGRPEPERVIDELGMSNHDLAEYIRREVLQRLPYDLREVLLRTSILDRVCPALIEVLTWRRDGMRILADLDRKGALVRHCGGAQHWYRYHELLRLLLYTELREQFPEQAADLHRAASDWYAANGLPADALSHALAAGDWHCAIGLLEAHWPEMLSGRGRSVATPFPPVPPDEVSTNPHLALAFAVQRRDAGDSAGMRLFLRTAERAAGGRAPDRLVRLMDAVRLADAQSECDTGRITAVADRLLATERHQPAAEHDEAVRAMALCATANARFALGDLDGMERALEECAPLVRRDGLSLGRLGVLGQIALAHLARGRLGAAMHCARLVLGAATDAGLTRAPDVGTARHVLAQVCMERGLLDEAEYHIGHGLSGDASVDPFAALSEPLLSARLHHLRGEPGVGLDVLRSARIGVVSVPPPTVLALATLTEAELCVADGQLAAARELLRHPIAREREPAWSAVLATKAYLLEGDIGAASLIWRQVAIPVRAPTIAVEAFLLRARLGWETHDTREAGALLERALEVAGAEGIRRPFLIHHELLRDMLVSHLSAGTRYGELLVELIKAAPAPIGSAGPRLGPLVESLTDRESMVLRYLGSTLSTAEIAGILTVSTNTVKTHVKNVYRKLDVGSRREAVRRARDLGLT